MSNDNTSWHGLSADIAFDGYDPSVHTIDDLLFICGLDWEISSGKRTKRTRMDYIMRSIKIVYKNTLSPELEKLVANTLLAQLDKQIAELEKSGRYRPVKNAEVLDFCS